MSSRRIDDLVALETRVREGLHRVQRDVSALGTDVARLVEAWRPEALAQHLASSAASRTRTALRSSPRRAQDFLASMGTWLSRSAGNAAPDSDKAD